MRSLPARGSWHALWHFVAVFETEFDGQSPDELAVHAGNIDCGIGVFVEDGRRVAGDVVGERRPTNAAEPDVEPDVAGPDVAAGPGVALADVVLADVEHIVEWETRPLQRVQLMVTEPVVV